MEGGQSSILVTHLIEELGDKLLRRRMKLMIMIAQMEKIAGGILGGAAGAALSRDEGRWWAIPLGVVTGSAIGCDIDGG